MMLLLLVKTKKYKNKVKQQKRRYHQQKHEKQEHQICEKIRVQNQLDSNKQKMRK